MSLFDDITNTKVGYGVMHLLALVMGVLIWVFLLEPIVMSEDKNGHTSDHTEVSSVEEETLEV